MPAVYKIDVARGIVFTRGYGVVTDDDIVRHAHDLKNDPLFRPTFRQFTDFSEVAEIKVTSEGVASILSDANPFPPDAVRAVYAPSKLAFGMSRMFEIRHRASAMLVTDSREEAERHVGLAPGESVSLSQG